MAETMKQTVAGILKSIERYNPANLQTLERYVEMQSKENTYDLEANLAVLKLYQFNPEKFNADITYVTLKHWVKKYGWRDDGSLIFIANQDENIKTKNITEKIEFDHLAPLMALL
ncbi:Eukaryotic translation initiation factor 3 subunit K [Operophtera brumata]|uniref:Eukaryotic translation initiation factor 3 subunit K n=1 Tax=Operophtera brumata TaxID=104452 RepID=A0A0L7L921_OPEBR|nr:Eukaryotic translation initiation factor 3 subunit K [Operophtera brumata]